MFNYILCLLSLSLVIFGSPIHDVQEQLPADDKNEKSRFPFHLSPWLRDGQLKRDPPFYSPYIVNLDQSRGRKLLHTKLSEVDNNLQTISKKNSSESSSPFDCNTVSGSSLFKTYFENGLQTSTTSSENKLGNLSKVDGIEYYSSPNHILQRADPYLTSKDVNKSAEKEFRSGNEIMNIDETIQGPPFFQRILNRFLSSILMNDGSNAELRHKRFEPGNDQIKEKDVETVNTKLSETEGNIATQILSKDSDDIAGLRAARISPYNNFLRGRHASNLRGGRGNYFVRVIVKKRLWKPENNLQDGEYYDGSLLNSKTNHPIPNIVPNISQSKSKLDKVVNPNINYTVNSLDTYSVDSNTSSDQPVLDKDYTLRSLKDNTTAATELSLNDDNSTTGRLMTSANISAAVMKLDDNGSISEGSEKTHDKSQLNQVKVRDVNKGGIDEIKSTTVNKLSKVLKQENESTRNDLALSNMNEQRVNSAAEEKADKFVNFFASIFGGKN